MLRTRVEWHTKVVVRPFARKFLSHLEEAEKRSLSTLYLGEFLSRWTRVLGAH